MSLFTALLRPFASFFSTDPSLAMTQAGLLAVVVLILFFLFYTLRDVILRTRSFTYQCLCVLLVAFLPGAGFLLYLLIRPARTIKEREMEAMLEALTVGFFGEDDMHPVEDVPVTHTKEVPKPSPELKKAEHAHHAHHDHSSHSHS